MQGDSAWGMAEDYGGGGDAWPEVIASNPGNDAASTFTARVRVRYGR